MMRFRSSSAMAPMMLTTARPSGPPVIEVLAEADELDVEMIEFVEHFEEVAHGPGDPVRGPDQEHLEAAAARISKQIVKTRPASFRPREARLQTRRARTCRRLVRSQEGELKIPRK